MSLQDLSNLRISGSKPTDSIWVLVGDCPRFIEPSLRIIRVAPTDKPEFMDWRSLVMLNVSIFEVGKHATLFNKTIHAVEAVNPSTLAIACRSGEAGFDAQHDLILNKIWKALQWHQ